MFVPVYVSFTIRPPPCSVVVDFANTVKASGIGVSGTEGAAEGGNVTT